MKESLRLVLDTSAYSHFRAGHPEVLDWMARAELILLPTTVLGELEAAFRQGSRYRENYHVLDEFLRESFVDIAPVTHQVAKHYGRIFSALRRAGTPVPVNDVWIAASTFSSSGFLLTLDSDFSRIPSLEHTVLTPASLP